MESKELEAGPSSDSGTGSARKRDSKRDQRSRLTVRLIREAFIRLLESADFRDITVSAICREAEINRATFYRYYDNQFDLLESIEAELISELEAHATEANCLDRSEASLKLVHDTQVDFLRCIERRMDLYRPMVERVHPNIFEKSRVMRVAVTTEALEPELGRAAAEYASDFITVGGQHAMTVWICKGQEREAPEEMADLLLKMVYGVLDAVRDGRGLPSRHPGK